MVEFKLIFKKKVSDDTAVAPLKKAVQNGTLGPLPVNPESLKIIDRIQDEGNLKPLCSKNSICNSPLVIAVGSIDARTGVDQNAVAEAVAPDLGNYKNDGNISSTRANDSFSNSNGSSRAIAVQNVAAKEGFLRLALPTAPDGGFSSKSTKPVQCSSFRPKEGCKRRTSLPTHHWCFLWWHICHRARQHLPRPPLPPSREN